MPSQTNEQALESTIEKRLTGSPLEELKAEGISLGAFAERKELYLKFNSNVFFLFDWNSGKNRKHLILNH